jgi:alpha/beta superfamily hydrolase
MHTKAVARAARGLVEAGAATLRFNFRGAGRSAGRFSGGAGELDDAARALRTLVETVGPAPLFLGGFSFGAHVSLQLGVGRDVAPSVAGLLGIAPPVDLFDFSFLEASRIPLLLAAGDADPFCPVSKLQALQARWGTHVVLEIFPAAGHLLLETLDALEEAVRRFTEQQLRRPAADPP